MNAMTPVNPAGHVEEMTGLLYVEGQLDPAAARDVVAHLGLCPACRRLLDTLKRESLLLRAALSEQDEPLPARLLAPRFSEGASWGWLIALGLAAMGLYTLWNVYVSPWMDNLDQSGFGGQFVFTWLMLNGAFWKGWNDMLQFIIVASLGVLGAVLLFVLRRNVRRVSSNSFFLGALLLVGLAHPPGASAAEFVKRNGSYDIPNSQTVKSDLFVMAGSVRVGGTVEGDLFCFCGSLSIEGHVTGDVFAFTHKVELTGKVDGNLRTFNGNLMVDGDVGRNVMSFAGLFQSTPRSHVGGTATLYAGDIQMEGPLGRGLAAFVGEGSLNAPIGGDVWLCQSTVEHEGPFGMSQERNPVQVGAHADIQGSFRFKGPKQPEISPQAHLTSSPQIEIITELPAYRQARSYRYNAWIWGIAFVVGLFLISVAPALVQETSREVARIGPPLGFGLAVFFGLPLAAVLGCITIVGLGLGISAFLIWLFLIFFAQVFAALWLGEVILGTTSGTWPITGRLAIGLLILRLGALLPVLGFWVRFLACVLGMGALAVVIYGRFHAHSAPPVVPVLPQAPVAPAT